MHNNVLSINHASSQSFVNVINILDDFSSISIQNQKSVAIFLNSLAIIFEANCQINVNEIEDIFISQLNQLGIYDVSIANFFFNTINQNNNKKYFINNRQGILHETINNIPDIKNILKINSEDIMISINLSNYINSFEILLKNDPVGLDLIMEFLIKHYMDNQIIDYNWETAHLLFNYYSSHFGFKQNLLDFFIEYSRLTFFKYKNYKKYELLENFILPYLNANFTLIDKKVLGDLLLNFMPNKITNDNSFDFSGIKQIVDLFIVHYPKDKKELFTKFVKSCFIKEQVYYSKFLLDILDQHCSLIKKDDVIFTNIELKEVFENFITFLERNNFEVPYCQKVIQSIEIFSSKLGSELFKLLINNIQLPIINKIKHNLRYSYVIEDLLDKYSNIVTKENIEYFIVTVSSINQNKNIIDEYQAIKLLKTYQTLFSDEEILKLNINLINNCLITNDHDYIVFVQDLLINFVNSNQLLGNSLINYLLNDMKNNLNDMNAILFHNYIMKYHLETLDIDLKLLNNIANQIIKMKSMVEFDKFNAIKNILNLIIMKNKNVQSKIIKFIELSIINDCLLAIELSKEYKNIIEDNNLKKLIKKSIIKFIEIDSIQSNSFNLLLDHLDILTDFDKYLLSKLIINKNLSLINEDNYLAFTNDGKCENILAIINHEDFRNTLVLFESNFFISLFNQILNNYKDDVQKIQEIVNMHQDFITSAQIEMVYFSTNTLHVANYIRTIQDQYNLELPIRNDIRTVHFDRSIILLGGNNNRLLTRNMTNAFHVHDYTNGLEGSVFSLIRFLLDLKKIKLENINRHEFINQYINLEDEQNNAIFNVLNKLQEDENYLSKFEHVLPYIVTFLNNNAENWFSDYKDKLLRWNIYLQSSFIESFQAYNQKLMNNNISCIKGIYERFFTPFRFLHPSFNALFVNQDVVFAFEYNIVNELLLLNDIVFEKLSKRYVENNTINVISTINEIFIIEFINKFNDKIEKTKNTALNLNPYPELLPIIDKELKRNSVIVTNFLDKIIHNIQSYLENIFINDIIIYDYMEGKLKQI